MSVGVRIRRTRNESSTCKYAVPRLHASRHSFVRPHYDSFEGSACFDAGASTHHQFPLGEDSRLALTGNLVSIGQGWRIEVHRQVLFRRSDRFPQELLC